MNEDIELSEDFKNKLKSMGNLLVSNKILIGYYQLKRENKRLKEELRIIKEHPIISKFYKEPTGIKCYMGGRGYGKTNYQLKHENNQLKDRIEKAIEYIEHKKFIREQVILERSYKLDDYEVRKLLEILKGEENE